MDRNVEEGYLQNSDPTSCSFLFLLISIWWLIGMYQPFAGICKVKKWMYSRWWVLVFWRDASMSEVKTKLRKYWVTWSCIRNECILSIFFGRCLSGKSNHSRRRCRSSRAIAYYHRLLLMNQTTNCCVSFLSIQSIVYLHQQSKCVRSYLFGCNTIFPSCLWEQSKPNSSEAKGTGQEITLPDLMTPGVSTGVCLNWLSSWRSWFQTRTVWNDDYRQLCAPCLLYFNPQLEEIKMMTLPLTTLHPPTHPSSVSHPNRHRSNRTCHHCSPVVHNS